MRNWLNTRLTNQYRNFPICLKLYMQSMWQEAILLRNWRKFIKKKAEKCGGFEKKLLLKGVIEDGSD